MTEDYIGHHIIASAWHNPDGWKPRLHIAWGEPDKTPVKQFTVNRRYATEKKAQEAGLSFAKKWIDDGKPDLEFIIREEIEEKMEELAREFAPTRDPEIRKEMYKLAKQLEEMETESSD